MSRIIFSVILWYVIATILLGLGYPLLITLIAQIVTPHAANGSLIRYRERVIGSRMIGQQFTRPEFFHSRPSPNNYQPMLPTGITLAPSNHALIDRVKHQSELLRKELSLPQKQQLPADMVLMSASGLDPHISVANALLQLPRVARARRIPEDALRHMVMAAVERNLFREAGVNVLELNRRLDEGSHE
jgi:K+-transporting ATPase ATPase C chain